MSKSTCCSGLDTRSLLSSLWVFVLFNIIFKDLHEFFRQGFISQIMTGTVNGVELTDGLMLIRYAANGNINCHGSFIEDSEVQNKPMDKHHCCCYRYCFDYWY